MTALNPGDDALLCLTVPALRVLAVRVVRVAQSFGRTTRVEVRAIEADGRSTIRPGATFDRRQLIALASLESLDATEEAQSAVAPMAGKAVAS